MIPLRQLVCILVCAGCPAKDSDCSQLIGQWTLKIGVATAGPSPCPTYNTSTLQVPNPSAAECGAGCTCRFFDFAEVSKHDDNDACEGKYELTCGDEVLSCSLRLITNTVGSGFCTLLGPTHPTNSCVYTSVNFTKK